MNIYRTDFGDVMLSDSFIAEADLRWPDKRCTRVPRWIDEVDGALTQLVASALAKNTRVRTVKSLSALGFC